MKPTTHFKTTFAISVLLIIDCCCAESFAQKPPIRTGYGRSTGRNYSTSVNGTRVLKQLIRSYDFKVDRYKKVSPRLERYDNVIWFPDNHAAPKKEVIERIETWLSNGWDRTLIYIGRDYNAEITYWEKMIQQATGKDQIEYRRRRAKAIANDQLSRRFFDDEAYSCRWFDVEQRGYQKSETLGGSLAVADLQKADLSFDRILVPPKNARYDVEVLLEVNDQPFVYSLTRSNWSDGKIIVVCNGSFLLNLPLVNHEHRMLAEELIGDAIYSEPVLFLESSGPIAVSDRDSPDQHNQWTWITMRPLRYIVPHLLFWCVLFCFVYFPIFGRPGKLRKRSTTNFRDHIKAMGRLLERADSDSEAKKWIADYEAHTSNKRTRTT